MEDNKINKMQTIWRVNGSPHNYDCILYHDYITKNICVVPRCQVCNTYHVPVSRDFVKQFMETYNYNVMLPDNITGLVILGKSNSKCLNQMRAIFESYVAKSADLYPIMSCSNNGYKVFTKFLNSLHKPKKK